MLEINGGPKTNMEIKADFFFSKKGNFVIITFFLTSLFWWAADKKKDSKYNAEIVIKTVDRLRLNSFTPEAWEKHLHCRWWITFPVLIRNRAVPLKESSVFYSGELFCVCFFFVYIACISLTSQACDLFIYLFFNHPDYDVLSSSTSAQ